MPSSQAMVERLNVLLTTEQLAQTKKELGDAPFDVKQLFRSVIQSGFERRVAGAWPVGIQAAIAGTLQRNMRREKPLGVTFAWKPAYDYEITIWECEETAKSEGGITILIGSRYPLDPHPVDIGKRSGKKRKPKRTD